MLRLIASLSLSLSLSLFLSLSLSLSSSLPLSLSPSLNKESHLQGSVWPCAGASQVGNSKERSRNGSTLTVWKLQGAEHCVTNGINGRRAPYRDAMALPAEYRCTSLPRLCAKTRRLLHRKNSTLRSAPSEALPHEPLCFATGTARTALRGLV